MVIDKEIDGTPEHPAKMSYAILRDRYLCFTNDIYAIVGELQRAGHKTAMIHVGRIQDNSFWKKPFLERQENIWLVQGRKEPMYQGE